MGSRFKRLPFTKKGSPSTPQASKKGRECLNGQRRLERGWISPKTPKHLVHNFGH